MKRSELLPLVGKDKIVYLGDRPVYVLRLSSPAAPYCLAYVRFATAEQRWVRSEYLKYQTC